MYDTNTRKVMNFSNKKKSCKKNIHRKFVKSILVPPIIQTNP